jgi:hypothetical protein
MRVRHASTNLEGTVLNTADTFHYQPGPWREVAFDDGLTCWLLATNVEEIIEPQPPVFTVDQLIAYLQAAKDRGLPGDTAVVIATNPHGSFHEVNHVEDPTDSDSDMWFTIGYGQEADSRFTPGGLPN